MAEPPALSIMQPWAHLIASGQKDIENRTWSTAYRGVVFIHAGKHRDRDFDLAAWRAAGARVPADLPCGGIVGQAEIIDCVTASGSPWFFGPFGFVLRHARALPFQPCRGALGLFRPILDAAPPPSHPRLL